jgi:hypothetical protein
LLLIRLLGTTPPQISFVVPILLLLKTETADCNAPHTRNGDILSSEIRCKRYLDGSGNLSNLSIGPLSAVNSVFSQRKDHGLNNKYGEVVSTLENISSLHKY